MAWGAVLRTRRTAPTLARPYRTWGYPVTPIVFIAFAAWLVGNTIKEKPADSAVGTALILAGLPIYLLGRRAPARRPPPPRPGFGRGGPCVRYSPSPFVRR